MAGGKAHHRDARERELRLARRARARVAIGELRPGHEVFVLTYGQFSLIDALASLLAQTGPAAVDLCTWTAYHQDVEQLHELVAGGLISRPRILIDRSLNTRKPLAANAMRERFGDDAIRTIKAHAKFVAIYNETWHLAVRTSMNLNPNTRMEDLEVSDDPSLCGFLVRVMDEIFAEQQPGVWNAGLPCMDGIAGVEQTSRVVTGIAMGSVRVSPRR